MMQALITLTIIIIILYTCYKRLDKEKIKKARKDRWFSSGVLLFWIIFFFPGAFIYLIIKMGDKK